MPSQWLQPTSTVATTGWKSSPDGRGSFDILWNCAKTIVLCAWTTICVNVPHPDAGSLGILQDKFHFLLLTGLGPELVFLLAFMQFQSARASVRQFKAGGYHGWTLRHGFYADMGGIRVSDRRWKSFPVNAAQVYYLIDHGYLDMPDITEKDISGRGKTDGLGRLVTILQALYFVLTTLARVPQGLAITTLEVTVLGFIFFTLASSIVWWYKPNDVEIGHTLTLKTSIEEILCHAGAAADEIYIYTPLDFVAHNDWIAVNHWNFYVNILRQLGLFPSKHKERPIQKFPSINFPKPQSRRDEMIVFVLALVYGVIFFSVWNSYFPTRVEQLLWHIICSIQLAICFIVGAVGITLDQPMPLPSKEEPDHGRLPTTNKDEAMKHRPEATALPQKSFHQASKSRSGDQPTSDDRHIENIGTRPTRPQNLVMRIWNKRFNNSVGKNPRQDVSFKALVVITPLCAAYTICRWFLLAEDVVNIRSLPTTAYSSVDWTKYIPTL